MSSVSLPQLEHAPEKPRWGEPCNGCGYCCAVELCKIAQFVHGEDHPAPCPEMTFHDGRFWCGIIEKTDGAMRDFMVAYLGIGKGCDADDPDPATIEYRDGKFPEATA